MKHSAMPGMAAGGDMQGSMKGMMKNMESMKMSGDTDRDFAMMMKVHHQGAIDMAQMELKNGKDPKMRAMAKGIIKAQEKEIRKFDDWIAKASEPSPALIFKRHGVESRMGNGQHRLWVARIVLALMLFAQGAMAWSACDLPEHSPVRAVLASAEVAPCHESGFGGACLTYCLSDRQAVQKAGLGYSGNAPSAGVDTHCNSIRCRPPASRRFGICAGHPVRPAASCSSPSRSDLLSRRARSVSAAREALSPEVTMIHRTVLFASLALLAAAAPSCAQTPFAPGKHCAQAKRRRLAWPRSVLPWTAAGQQVGRAGELPDPRLKLGLENLPVTGSGRFRYDYDFMTQRSVGIAQEFPNAAKRSARNRRAARASSTSRRRAWRAARAGAARNRRCLAGRAPRRAGARGPAQARGPIQAAKRCGGFGRRAGAPDRRRGLRAAHGLRAGKRPHPRTGSRGGKSAHRACRLDRRRRGEAACGAARPHPL